MVKATRIVIVPCRFATETRRSRVLGIAKYSNNLYVPVFTKMNDGGAAELGVQI